MEPLEALMQLPGVLVGAAIGFGATVLQANRSHRLQVDRDRQEHYEQLIRLMVEERADTYGTPTSRSRLREIELHVDLIPPAQSKRQMKGVRELRERCNEGLSWIDAFGDPYLIGFSGLRDPGYPHKLIVVHLVEVVSAAYQGEELPERSGIFGTLEKAERESQEFQWENRDDEELEAS
ncbi:hypothetical protein [Bacillus mobilis]